MLNDPRVLFFSHNRSSKIVLAIPGREVATIDMDGWAIRQAKNERTTILKLLSKVKANAQPNP